MKGYTVNHWHHELNIIVVNIVNIHVIIWNALNINTTYTEQTSLVDFALTDLLSSNGHSSHSLVLWCLVHLFSNEVIIFKQKDKYTLWKMIKLKIYIELSKYIKLLMQGLKNRTNWFQRYLWKSRCAHFISSWFLYKNIRNQNGKYWNSLFKHSTCSKKYYTFLLIW